MGAKENISLVTKQLQAVGARDESAYASAYRDDAVLRTAGVPRSLGGVLEGRAAIVESFRNQAHHQLDVRQIFGEGDAVCAVAKRSSRLAGTEFLRGNQQPYTAYESIVYRIEDGLIKEQTTYVNWLDVYAQSGLVDLADLIC